MSLDRRHMLLSSGALATWLTARAKAAPAGVPSGNGYFLSKANPVATRDQKELEELCLRLLAHPDVQAGATRAKAMWARAFDHSALPELWATFDAAMADYCFRSIMVAANSDAAYPRVFRVYSPAGHWLGHDVPASRWGSENPDNCYRIIPVEQGGSYRITGQRGTNPPSSVSYTLVADTDTSITLGLLDQRDLVISSDGMFVITLDDQPTNGRPNHIQMPSDARYVFIRDSMGDWRQTPNALRAERINPPGRQPLSMDELARRAARAMLTGVYFEVFNLQTTRNTPVNTMSKPILAGAIGGLKTQVNSMGWFRLADDEAAIITADPVDSAYRSFVLYDFWCRSLEYRDRQTSLNNAQMAADADGRVTIIVAHRDPGVQNWIDTTGLHETSGGFRWQGLPGNIAAAPGITTRVVKFAELASALPPGVKHIDAAERARQMAERKTLFDRRFVDS